VRQAYQPPAQALQDLPSGDAAVEGLAVEGLAVEGLAVEGLAVEGLAVEGLAVTGLFVCHWLGQCCMLIDVNSAEALAEPVAHRS
jgi:hypothetical protein